MVLGVGIDVIEIERIKKVLEKRNDEQIKKIFTDKEITYCKKYKDSIPHFAARFAAKEAFYKALSKGIIHFSEIEILNYENGKPYIELHGKTKILFEEIGSPNIFVSLSHSDTIATAIVIIEKTDGFKPSV